jgi:hypothetical protein
MICRSDVKQVNAMDESAWLTSVTINIIGDKV